MNANKMSSQSARRKLLAVTLACAALFGCSEDRPRVNVLTADGGDSVSVMDFSNPISLDPISPGWFHRTFKRHDPMEISQLDKDGNAAIRLATNDSASMLFRMLDVQLSDYPLLSWQWLIEQGIDADFDEMTGDGDDHPARFFLGFRNADGEEHHMEIVWGNEQLKAGDWKHISNFLGTKSFPHYVANGGRENEGKWYSEQVDLATLYTELWGSAEGVSLIELALFCDTDQTGGSSVAYFADVELLQRPQ